MTTFNGLTLLWKFIISIVILVVLGLGISGVKSCRDRIHDSAFDAGQKIEEAARKEKEKEIEKLTIERDAAIKKAEESEGNAKIKEGQAVEGEKTYTAVRKQVKQLNKGLTAEQVRYRNEVKNASTRVIINACKQWLEDCERAKRLHVKPADEPCTCDSK